MTLAPARTEKTYWWAPSDPQVRTSVPRDSWNCSEAAVRRADVAPDLANHAPQEGSFSVPLPEVSALSEAVPGALPFWEAVPEASSPSEAVSGSAPGSADGLGSVAPVPPQGQPPSGLHHRISTSLRAGRKLSLCPANSAATRAPTRWPPGTHQGFCQKVTFSRTIPPEGLSNSAQGSFDVVKL